MNKVQTKRFAFLAILMSLFLAVTALAFMLTGKPFAAAADGETEMTFGREILPKAWEKTEAYGMSYVDVPTYQLSQFIVSSDIHNGLTNGNGESYVKVVRGSQSYNAGNVYCANGLRLYFNNTGYYGDGAQNGDKLVIGAGFSVTVSGTKYICTDGISWTFNGNVWQSDLEEDLSKYSDMTATMNNSSQYGSADTVFFVQTNSASQTVDDNNVMKVLPYVSMAFPNGAPAVSWYCRVNRDEARFFVYNQEKSGNIGIGGIPVGSQFKIKAGFRLDEVSALKEDVTFVYKSSGWMKLVPATEMTVANENNLSLNNGATLQLKVTLAPADSSDDIVYEALDTGVSVSASGLVTGKAVGTSQVKITAGSIEKTVSITVKTPPTIESISVNGTLEMYQYARITELSGSDSAIGALEGVYHYSDETTDKFPITKDMLSGWDKVNPDVAGNYTVKLTKDTYQTDVTVTVKPSTVLTVKGSGHSMGAFWVMFAGSKSTVDYRPGTSIDAESAATLENIRPYVQANLASAGSAALTLAMQANYSAGADRTINLYWQPGGAGVASYTKGDIVTLKKGFSILENERLAADVQFVFDGEQWVKLVEPTSLSISNKESTLFLNVTHTLQIATAPEGANGVLTFESDHPEYATVSETGVITPKKLTDGTVAKVTVTVRYKDLSDSFEFTIENEPVKTGIEIEDKIPMYYVPKGSSFTEAGFELYYHFVYDNGKSGSFSVNAEQLNEDAFDFDTVGDRELTITVETFTATVTVHVYELKSIGWWQALGVDGYGDDRNQAGQFNGSMLVTARNYSSSAANITGQKVNIGVKEINKMFEYVTYTTADGTEYTSANQKLGGWLLGSTILINVNGKGFTGAPENGYMLGDKIKFAKGMPLYGWSGELDPTIDPNDVSTPKAGTGCMYVIGVLEDDFTYFCYDQNDTYSMWTPYVEYTDFTVRSSISITVEGVGSLGATFTPADATTGYFTYVSSDTSVVTVNESGNLVGVKEGTATITVTSHPVEASGYEKEPSSKTVSVTVKKGIAKVSGSFTVNKSAAFEKGNYKIKVEYTDGTVEEIALDDDRVLAEDVDTSVVGESNYVVMVTIDGASKRGTFTVNVQSGGCGSYLTGGSIALLGTGLALALAAVVIRKKKQS